MAKEEIFVYLGSSLCLFLLRMCLCVLAGVVSLRMSCDLGQR